MRGGGEGTQGNTHASKELLEPNHIFCRPRLCFRTAMPAARSNTVLIILFLVTKYVVHSAGGNYTHHTARYAPPPPARAYITTPRKHGQHLALYAMVLREQSTVNTPGLRVNSTTRQAADILCILEDAIFPIHEYLLSFCVSPYITRG